MKSFKTYINEGKYPIWVRVTVGSLILRIRKLSQEIENEEDPVRQNRLMSQQNKLLSYFAGLGIGISSSDSILLKKLGKFYEESLISCSMIEKKKLYGFDDGKLHKFVVLKFDNIVAFNRAKGFWYDKWTDEDEIYHSILKKKRIAY